MVGSQKILTVSYGTFSCTLEGFEDSFETMKAIAEYFRDLAAEDRYFGAEPPQPDAEMLARIAEREIARRVEARMEPSGIVLRVGQSLDQTPEQAPATPAPVHAAGQVMPPSAPAEPAPALAPAESVAAKLQRIRSVVGKGATAPLVPTSDAATFDETTEDAIDDTEARIDAAVAEAMAAPFVAEHAATSDAESQTAPEAEAFETALDDLSLSDAPVTIAQLDEDALEEPAVEEAPAEVALDDQSFVDDVQPPDASTSSHTVRARVIKMRKADFDRVVASGALVAQAEESTSALPGADVAADLAEADESDLAEAELADLADLDGYNDSADIADLSRLDAPGLTLSPDEEAELLAELAAVESNIDVDDLPPADDLETAQPPSADLDDLAATLAAIAAETDAEQTPVAQVEADPEVPEEDHHVSTALESGPEESAEPEPAATLGASVEDEDDIMSGVLRAIEAGEPAAEAPQSLVVEHDEDLPELAEDPTGNAALESGLSAGPIESDSALEMKPESDASADDELSDAPAPGRSRFASPEADEAALDRILTQTDAQMSGPDAARRREAIAQLRAAVAATEAARALGETPAEEPETEGTFREDLRQAVRPRRPVAGQPDLRGERPRPAPLKLVASQRIDLPTDAAPVSPGGMQPIRPRRVTVDRTAAEDAPASMPRETAAAMAASGSFTDFAERMGATSLADLLEAAAAYTAFIEGSEDFSRPQILRKVSQLSPETSREDGLRSFGTLLREGRFRRSPRAGRFEVAEDTRFNPDRHAG